MLAAAAAAAPRVVCIGGGVAGLRCTQHLLHQARGTPLDVTILEASDDVGGRVRTDLVDGFQLDRGFQVWGRQDVGSSRHVCNALARLFTESAHIPSRYSSQHIPRRPPRSITTPCTSPSLLPVRWFSQQAGVVP